MPENSTLAQVAAAWNDAGFWAQAVDDCWRWVYATDDLNTLLEGADAAGRFYFEGECLAVRLNAAGLNIIEEARRELRNYGGWVLADLPGGRDELREKVDPELREVVDELAPSDDAAKVDFAPPIGRIGFTSVGVRVRDVSGRIVGTVFIAKPSLPMSMIWMLTGVGDLDHFKRMQQLATAERRPAAILFVDLDGSTQLAKRLPTANYFALVRSLTKAADQCVIDEGGLVGRHAGDGVAAFFAAETTGSESAAARGCIKAARSFQTATRRIAERHDLAAEDLTIRAGLHWGATLYTGSVITRGRSEVTALGDAVNEAARIETCATGGRLLASKELIERLDSADAATLGINPGRMSYVQLADLDTATEKARRDAPSIAVNDVGVGAL
jgi:class 3 adenylate cyclase